MKKFLQDLLPPQPYGMSFETDDSIEVLHEKTKWFRETFQGQLGHIVRYLSNPVYITRGASGYNEFPQLPLLALPAPGELSVSLADVLKNRRSGYNLGGKIDLATLSTLLQHAVGVNKETFSTVAKNVKISLRPYPSPGGLYPTEIYAYLNNVEGVEPCIVHYDARNHCLRVLKYQETGQDFKKIEIQSGEKPVSAPVILVLTMVPQRVTVKYGGRGYRMGLLEVGHASQNICLVAKGLALDTLVYGSYFDNELAEVLEIDAVTETVASVILIGQEAK